MAQEELSDSVETVTRKATAPYFDVEAGIQELRGTGTMEWVYHLSLVCNLGVFTGILFTSTLRNTFKRRNITYLKSSVLTLLSRPHMALGTEAFQP